MTGARAAIGRRILSCWQLYVFLVPAVLFVAIFRYGPMYGLQLAFKSFNIRLGITGSPWIGFAHFACLFSYYRFAEVFLNTLILAVYKLAASFPLPIILAISLGEVANVRLRRTLQRTRSRSSLWSTAATRTAWAWWLPTTPATSPA